MTGSGEQEVATVVGGGEPASTALPVGRPADLISLVPWLLGFWPGNADLVVLGAFPPRNQVWVTLRYDLDDPPDPELAARRASTVAADLAGQGCVAIVLIGFGPERLVGPQVALVRAAADAAGLKISELLRVEDGRYWSYRCADPACCLPDGTPYSAVGDRVTAAFAAAGATAPLPSREALAATIAPANGQEAMAMRAATARAVSREARLRRRAERRRPAGKPGRPASTAACRAMRAAIATYRAGGSITSVDELAWLAGALARLEVRDAAWRQADPGHAAADQRLWATLARLTPGGLAAAPASLLAWCAWLSGNHVLARMAVDRAEESHPGYAMAGLLSTVIEASWGLPPERLAELHRAACRAATEGGHKADGDRELEGDGDERPGTRR